MRLGIVHQRIQPGRPRQNGAHERMHKTMERRAIRPPRANAAAQQRAFHAFRMEYNEERPHDALHGKTPASR
jgi:transposase InsO family protein